MINQYVEASLKNLEECLRTGAVTPGREVDAFTLVCWTQRPKDGGILYFQGIYEQLPKGHQDAFKGKVRGDTTSGCKIVGVFDVWPPATLRGEIG